jgi:predicted GNAT family acetyltransferase
MNEIRIVSVTYEEAFARFEKIASKEDMAGWSKNAQYYYVLFAEQIAGVSSIQYYAPKVKFNNHYVYKEYRGKGLFKVMFHFLMEKAIESKRKVIEATCTEMSVDYYLKNGFEVVKEYKRFYAVKKTL